MNSPGGSTFLRAGASIDVICVCCRTAVESVHVILRFFSGWWRHSGRTGSRLRRRHVFAGAWPDSAVVVTCRLKFSVPECEPTRDELVKARRWSRWYGRKVWAGGGQPVGLGGRVEDDHVWAEWPGKVNVPETFTATITWTILDYQWV